MISGALLFLVLGMAAGGALNLVIDRYPEYLNRTWTAEALEQIGEQEQAIRARALRPQLPGPNTRCTQCRGMVTVVLYAPVLSWIVHRGHLACCGWRVPKRYFRVEILTGGLWVLSAHVFGASLDLLPILVLVCGLVVLSFIDLEHYFLPDQIVGPLLFAGLVANTQFFIASSLSSSVWGAVGGYLAFWLIHTVHRLLTREREGLGMGDCKLMAAIGAWVGVEMLVQTIMIAAGSCLLFSLFQAGTGRNDGALRLAFGPWLGMGGLCSIYCGNVFSVL